MSNVLESNYYQTDKSNGSPHNYRDEDNKDHSLSLNDMNTNLLAGNDLKPASALDNIDADYGMNETDVIEDDRLLKSLEKRFRHLDEKH